MFRKRCPFSVFLSVKTGRFSGFGMKQLTEVFLSCVTGFFSDIRYGIVSFDKKFFRFVQTDGTQIVIEGLVCHFFEDLTKIASAQMYPPCHIV